MKQALLILGVLVTGCGPGEPPAPQLQGGADGGVFKNVVDHADAGVGGGGSGVAPPMNDLAATMVAAHAGPQVVAYDGAMLGQLLVYSVTAAYLNIGQVVTTGTVTWSSVDAATYTAMPADKLVVVNPQGGKAEFVVRSINTTNPNDFFKGNWSLDFHVVVAGAFDLDLAAQSTGGVFKSTGKGTLTNNGIASTIDVASDGSTYFESDSTGSEYRNTYRMTGNLNRGAVVRTVDEQWTFRMVTSRTNNKTSSASDAVRVDNGALALGGDTYRWNNCRTSKAFTDGKPSQESAWQAKCDGLTKNGTPFGQYRVVSQQFGKAGGFIGFNADFSNGASVELEKWQAY